jgi:uncharacterized protein
MNCPLCVDSVLDVTFHAGIELDICPRCRGVWLDRGELDRIAADSGSRVPRSERSPDRGQTSSDPRSRRSEFDDDDRYQRGPGDRRGNKRKKSLGSRLGDVFEEIIDL